MSATGVKFNFWDKTDSGSRSASTQLSSLEKTGSILIDYGRANFASSGTWGSISDNYVKVFTSICGAQAVKPDVTIIGGGVVGLSIYGDAVTAFSGISAMPHALNVTHHFAEITNGYFAGLQNDAYPLTTVAPQVEPVALASTALPVQAPLDRQRSVSEELDAILLQARELREGEEEGEIESRLNQFIREFRAAALTAIYRVLFEGDSDAGPMAHMLEALACLPKSLEFSNRQSMLRASLLHSDIEVRFVAARALARFPDGENISALRQALNRETHPALRRNIRDVLAALESLGGLPTS